MRRSSCPNCDSEVFFADDACLSCGTDLVYDVSAADFVPLDEHDPCANREVIGCNWIAVAGGTGLCRSCELTSVVPPLEEPAAVSGWAESEAAKRRLVAQLVGLGLLGAAATAADPAFEMLWSSDGSVTIGHADGLITIDVGEADDARRERLRHRLSEPYRTLLGHMRHEIGHFYWDRVAALDGALDELRATFGDERADYQGCIDRHYAEGPPDDWPSMHVSEYATMHPWEDWAESFAHCLHMLDVIDTAADFQLTIGRPTFDGVPVAIGAVGDRATGPSSDFDDVHATWTALSVAVNALNRSMDQPDLYPFAPSDTVIDKVALVHGLLGRLSAP